MSEHTPEPPFSDPCVVHRPITFRGGGEDYAGELALALDAPLYTLRQTVPLEQDAEVVEFGAFGRIRNALVDRTPFYDVALAAEYENFDVPERHDAVITTGAMAKAVVHHPHQRRYHLAHAPTRWLYEWRGRHDDRIWPVRWVKRLYESYVRTLDVSMTHRIDDFVANSEVIARWVETYYRRDPTAIIYPPVPVDRYWNEEPEGFLLSLGRLEENKRVDEVVEAVAGTDHRLVVAGTGSMEDDLRAAATDNVEVLGYVSEERKRELLARCDALVFNAYREAFGIVPVEALASGKPVVGIDEGFTRYQLQEEVNGVLYDRGGENLRRAIDRMYELDWDAGEIRETARQYDVDEIASKWRSLLGMDDDRA